MEKTLHSPHCGTLFPPSPLSEARSHFRCLSYPLLFSSSNESWRIVFLSLSELRKVLRLGERGRQRFLTAWIRSSSLHFSLCIPLIDASDLKLTRPIRLAGIVTRRPLVLQLHKIEEGSREYAEFLHLPRKRFTDFGTFLFSSYNSRPLYFLLLLVNK